jgi:hypothetical protein
MVGKTSETPTGINLPTKGVPTAGTAAFPLLRDISLHRIERVVADVPHRRTIDTRPKVTHGVDGEVL